MPSDNSNIYAALIAAFVTLLVVFIRDVMLERYRSGIAQRREIIDRKLSQVYGPLWMAFGGEDGQLGNVLSNREMLSTLSLNFHLLSPEIQDILSRYVLSGKWVSGELHTTHAEKKAILEVSPALKRAIRSEIESIQKEFAKL